MAKLPITTFITTRLTEYDPTFEVRPGTGWSELFIKPLSYVMQPLRDEADNIQIAQSFRRILLTQDPDSFDEEPVDALAANLFVPRNTGAVTGGVARAYYSNQVDREWPAGGAVFTGSNGVLYSNPAPFSITASEMGSQIENGLFYYDIPVVSSGAGAFDLPVAGLVSLAGDSDVLSVTNKAALTGGRVPETNTQLIERTKNSIAVRDLLVGKGFNAVLFESFPATLLEAQPIGMGDPEMMRDILYNVHIGSKVDGYVKTATISTGTFDVVGILLDTTRQAFSSTSVALNATDPVSLGNPSIDRSNGLLPVVQQVKINTAASFTGSVDLTVPLDLHNHQYINLGIDGTVKTILVAGTVPSATSAAEIIKLINAQFANQQIATLSGGKLKITSPTKGLSSQVIIADPSAGTNAVMQIFGLTPGTPHVYQGDGPIVFVEGSDYTIVDSQGLIEREIGAVVLPYQATGQTTANSAVFYDSTPGIFTPVSVNDIVTILSGGDAADYRVLAKTDVNHLVLDAKPATSATVNYVVNRTGIKAGEQVYVTYYYNPLSIDIGPLVILDPATKTRGVRPGREDMTITDVAFLRIKTIELIDPLTKQGINTFLSGLGGYGVGGYGAGGYGVGSGPDYRLQVNSPTERFSAFEDSFIAIDSAFEGYSMRVTYEYAPDVLSFHNFVRSAYERVLDGDLLMKHFLPAYVSGEITYSVDVTDSTIPSNDTLTGLVKQFINLRKAGSDLVFSAIEQFLVRVTDPFDRFGTKVNAFTLTADVQMADGTTLVLSGQNQLTVPNPNPAPKFTTAPISPRIVHFIADNIVLTRV